MAAPHQWHDVADERDVREPFATVGGREIYLITLTQKPVSSNILCQAARGRPPAIQAVQRSIFRIAASGTGLPFAMSANCSRPPGRRTR
jgi:hypothetical protein